MNKSTLIEVGYRLRHAVTFKQKRAVIDSYDELKDMSIEKVNGLLFVNEAMVRGLSVAKLKRLKYLQRMHVTSTY